MAFVRVSKTFYAYCCQHPNGEVFVHIAASRDELPSHFRVHGWEQFEASFTVDAGHDPNRTYPNGLVRETSS